MGTGPHGDTVRYGGYSQFEVTKLSSCRAFQHLPNNFLQKARCAMGVLAEYLVFWRSKPV